MRRLTQHGHARKRGRNKGHFKKGFDPRRSAYRPSREECQRGYLAALAKCSADWDLHAWFYYRYVVFPVMW